MTPENLYKQFAEWCVEHANEDMVKKYSRYFKENYDAYGLTQQLMDEKAKEILEMPGFNMKLLLKSAPLFFKNGKYEATSILLMLLNRMQKQYTPELFKELASWFALGIRNWAHADMLGMFILPEFMKQGLIRMNDFDSWLISPYKFQQRCVPVTLIKNAKNGEDVKVLFNYITPLMMTGEREVRQGVGWFLKECWKIKPLETEEFLLKWKDTAPRLIFQLACEKMTPENKLRFKKAK